MNSNAKSLATFKFIGIRCGKSGLSSCRPHDKPSCGEVPGGFEIPTLAQIKKFTDCRACPSLLTALAHALDVPACCHRADRLVVAVTKVGGQGDVSDACSCMADDGEGEGKEGNRLDQRRSW